VAADVGSIYRALEYRGDIRAKVLVAIKFSRRRKSGATTPSYSAKDNRSARPQAFMDIGWLSRRISPRPVLGSNPNDQGCRFILFLLVSVTAAQKQPTRGRFPQSSATGSRAKSHRNGALYRQRILAASGLQIGQNARRR